MILDRFIGWIKSLFGATPQQQTASGDVSGMEAEYRKIDQINFTAIMANKLTNIALADSSMDVNGAEGAARAELIGDALKKVWAKNHKITAQTLGTGGRVLVPYVAGGRIYVDIVSQIRLYICATEGDRITEAALLADSAEYNNRIYYRWVYYRLDGDTLNVQNRSTDESGKSVELKTIPGWADITEEYAVQNVDRMPFAYLRCPVDSRLEKDVYGVSITYDSSDLIDQIKDHMKIIAREYKFKRPMLGLADTMWQRSIANGERAIDRARKTVQDSEDPFIPVDTYADEGKPPWLIYDPAIRDSAMYARLDRLFELLEKSVGTSNGILTARESSNATATEIRAANHDTFAIVDAVRAMWERAMDDLAYAVDLLAEVHSLTPSGGRGSYEILWDWDMSLFESSQETFNQMSELNARKLISDAELRQWVRGGTLEENQQALDEIRAQSASGGSEIDRILAAVNKPVDNLPAEEE